VKWDFAGGTGSRWNVKLCKLLAEQCNMIQRSNPPIVKVSPRVKIPQLEKLMSMKFSRVYHSFSRFRSREGEEEADRQTRMINSLKKAANSKRGQSSRKSKFTLRQMAVDSLIARGESMAAMRFANRILKDLKEAGMSSEEEYFGADGTFKGYKTSKMTWRCTDVTNVLHRIDDIQRQLRNPRGSIKQARYSGGSTRRKEVKNLTYEYYDESWLEDAIAKGEVLVKSGSCQGWMGYDSFARNPR
jgi:hypothetical protein